MERTKTSTSVLFWNDRGHVACAAHAPLRLSDTWRWERWQPVPDEVRAEVACLSCEPSDDGDGEDDQR